MDVGVVVVKLTVMVTSDAPIVVLALVRVVVVVDITPILVAVSVSVLVKVVDDGVNVVVLVTVPTDCPLFVTGTGSGLVDGKDALEIPAEVALAPSDAGSADAAVRKLPVKPIGGDTCVVRETVG